MSDSEPERLGLDDSAALGGYDLPAMRAAIEAEIAGGGGGGGGAAMAAAAAVLGVVLLGAGGMWLMAAPAVPAVVVVTQNLELQPAPTGQIAAARTDVVGADPAPRAATGPRPTAAPAPGRATTPRPEAVAAVAVAQGQRQSAPGQETASGTAEAQVSAPARGDLAEQTALFQRGQSALAAGDLGVAGEAFQTYLERWPEGAYRDDALVSVLDLTIRHGAWEAVEPLAGQLGQVQALSARHPEFRRVRAEALVRLDRCEEALGLAEGLDRAEASVIRRSCRLGVAP